MIRTLSIIFVFLMIASSLILAGCASKDDNAPAADSPRIGIWKAAKGAYNDEELPIEDVLTDSNAVFELELRADATATITAAATESGTWTETSDEVNVKVGEREINFKIEGDTLCTEFMQFKIIFEKQ